jgi:hypothetical protein
MRQQPGSLLNASLSHSASGKILRRQLKDFAQKEQDNIKAKL